jgi:hypothetical protein
MGLFNMMTMMHQQQHFLIAGLLVLLQMAGVQAFYLPGVNPQAFAEDDA